jgi:hypothetical protein
MIKHLVSKMTTASAENANLIPSKAWGGFDGRTGTKKEKQVLDVPVSFFGEL